MKNLKFEELNLSKQMLKAIKDIGFEEAAPVQSATIPLILEGKDVIAQSQTGTGKTAAFAIPTIERIDVGQKQLQAIVLCPTRELVIQVTEEFRKLTKYALDINVVPIYGGQEIGRQFRALANNPQIIVGTPGRLIDHLRRGSIKTQTIKFVILDEADEMLDMGFREDIEFILKDTPSTRQTIMFSATMPDEILRLVKTYQKKDVVNIDLTNQKINAPDIEQIYFELQEYAKPEALARLIDLHNINLALVFCNTKVQVDNLVEILKNRGYFAEGLHGDLSQGQRDKVMKNFRKGVVEILVATDVAGRGIDVNNIEAVFNYDLPRDDEDYVHRIGRTGRAGKSGKAFTFIVGRQIYHLKRIERINNLKISRQQIPSIGDINETIIKNCNKKITKVLEEGALSKYINLVENLMGDNYTALDIAAAFLKISIEDKKEGFDEKLNFENMTYQEESRGPRRPNFNRYNPRNNNNNSNYGRRNRY
jgi:ATP-dependent RNA helicase DeaD